jgi:tyrosyl-tRNA synthetase
MLKFEIDSIDAVDESLRSFYTEHEGKYRLKVEGIDPADELKKALNSERSSSKEAKTRLAELERQKQEDDERRLAEKQEFEKLWQSEKQAKSQTLVELETLKKSIADKERNEAALRIAGSLTRDTKRAELLKKEALNYVQISPDGIVFADGMDDEKLKQKLIADYPFLIDGNQSSGGNSKGSTSGGVSQINRDDFTKLAPAKQMEYLRSGGKVI